MEERHFLFFNVVDQVNKDDHRSYELSVVDIIIVINICSVIRKDGKKWTKQYINEES